MINRIEKVGYGNSYPLKLIELTEGMRTDTIEVNFLKQLLTSLEGKRILDLCAGTGRLSIELAKCNAIVYAIDGSQHMVHIMRKRISKLSKREKKNINILFGDACELDYPSNIDVAIITDGSIGYFCTNPELVNILNRVFNALKSNGIFIVHLFNIIKKMNKDRVGRNLWIKSKYSDPNRNHFIIQYRKSMFEDVDKLIIITTYKNYYYCYNEIVEKFSFEMYYRLYSVAEVINSAEKVGFSVRAKYGDYQRKPISKQSDVIICFEKK